MKKSVFLVFSMLIVSLTFGPAIVSAEVQKAKKKKVTVSKQIPCPPIIGDKQSATLYPRTKPAKERFACYRTTRDATRDGFKSLSAASGANFTGWYRTRLKLVKDTCNPTSLSDGPALFIQVKQNDSEVFAEFCPTLGKFSGVTSPNGFTVTALGADTKTASFSVCGDGLIRDHQFFEFSQVVGGSAAFNVRYSVVRRCLDPNAIVQSCVRDYTGIGFHETHELWPPVADNIDALPQGCAMALTKCADCHPELSDLLP